ncbi:2-succinyl-5-enolpyruvyl-6-hydroxy-3-cyclohexene-1-carboxylic-acid synthase [Haloglomus halophilum]|uniref:2-succinyl-5-enolpyruvyl-6-hydroxy-3- cyclohexene-1-carboxylic-acid synthase n=1 Tax=Haloglomus halophilum TaxID=2962672 RepID=UPI0020C94066|nr:2-succinyl-5-enolpyruvyl-6-hydroxy-3-cyclohexene-1-carboxylic-acid synthase [Haloglomus halophilum]
MTDGPRDDDPPTTDAPNRNTLWGRVIVQELVRSGVHEVCLTPGSRCTPLTNAFAEHPDVRTFTHIDERSSAFFALGRAKATGRPTPLVCTSGTALANYHPAVMEAANARVPMLLLTADRPRVLQDSGANQTVDQEKLYGDAVRAYRTLPEPEVEDRKVRALRTAVARAVTTSTREAGPPGPVHLNVPFQKPLEPTPVAGDVPGDWGDDTHALAASGRADERPYVATTPGRPDLSAADRARVVEAVEDAERGLVVAGPADAPTPDRDALLGLARATGFPVLADPLSGLRFGEHVDTDGVLVCGGYDSFLDAPAFDPAADASTHPAPDLVLRFGASPTSKTLRHYLRDATRVAGTRQFVVDPAGGWREAEFVASDLVVADPTRLAATVSGRVEAGTDPAWRERFVAAERAHWATVAEAPDPDEPPHEGQVLATVADRIPDPATLFVSNSMPVRDLDRFGEPRMADLRVLGNRGASGIDGIASSALGAGADDDPLVLVTGDLAFYHDANGLLALPRNDLDATIVVINNDGGGIFHVLPIEEYEGFTEFFRTPLGVDLSHLAAMYGYDFGRVHAERDGLDAFADLFDAAVGAPGGHVVEVVVDGEASHRTREALHERVHEAVEEAAGAAVSEE